MHRIAKFAAVSLFTVLGLSAASPAADPASYWLVVGREMENMTSLTASIQAYERVVLLRPDDCATLIVIGNIYLRQADWPLATDAFNRSLACRANDATALTGLGAALWGSGERVRAINAWRLAVTTQPEHIEARLRLGDALIRRGELEEGTAILLDLEDRSETLLQAGLPDAEVTGQADLALALAEAVDSPAAASRRLASHVDAGPLVDPDERIYLIGALAQAAKPTDPGERARLTGIALAQVQAWAPAARALRKALSLRPGDAEILAFLGFVESKQGRPAHDLLVASVAAGPDNWLSHFFLGQYLLEAGAPSQGLSELLQSQVLAPDNAAVALALGDAYLALGDPSAAELAFKTAVSLSPADIALNKRLIVFYVESAYKSTGNGLPAARSASNLAPEDAELQDALGWLYWLSGDAHRGFLHLFTAWQLDSNRAETFYHLGKYYEATGWSEAASNALRRATEIDTRGDVRGRIRHLALEQAR